MRTEHSLLLAVLAALGLSPRPLAQFQFEERLPKSYMPRGLGAVALAAGDVDGDGDLDLVLETAGTRLYLNDGLGRFTDASATNMPAAALSTNTLALGDVDGDGDLDLVLAGDYRDQLYLNDGTGKFTDVSATHMPAHSAFTRGVTLADLDGDLDPDLLFANPWDEDRLFLNDGNGVFVDATAGRLPTDPESTSAFEAVDVDADRDLDLVLANLFQDRLYLNDGTGRFTDGTAGRMPAYAGSTSAVGAADVDGDGDPDLVLGNKGSPDRLYLNDGSGTFADVTEVRLPQDQEDTGAVKLEDVDGDGDDDVLLGNARRNRLYVNDGTGTFTDVTAQRLPAPRLASFSLAVGDVDGDADLDLVFGELTQNRLLLNDGTARFANATPVCTPIVNTDISAGALVDVDRDADLDVLLGADLGTTVLLQNDGRGCFTNASAQKIPGGPSRTQALAVGDVDGDGDVDAVFGSAVVSSYPGGLQSELFINDGRGAFVRETAERLPQRMDGTHSLALGDLDGDGDLDLVLGNGVVGYYNAVGQPNRLYLNDGSGVFTDATADRLPARNTVTRGLALGDVDGDGDLDLATGDTGSGSPNTPEQNALYLNDGSGSFVDVTATQLPAVLDTTYALAFGDVDADGDLDLVVANRGTSRLLLNDGAGAFRDAPPGRLPAVPRGSGVAFGDVDEDGDLDLAMSGYDWTRLLLNDGSGSFLDVTGSRLPRTSGSVFVALGDTDGDGDLDLQLDNRGRSMAKHFVNLHRQLSAPLLPILSRTYELEFHARPGYEAMHSAVAVLGLSRLQPPVSIAGLGNVYVAPPYLVTPPVTIPAGTGRASLGLSVPPAPSLLGFELFAQGLVVDIANPSQPKLTGYVVDAIVR